MPLVVEVPVSNAVGLAQLKLLLMAALALVMVFDNIVNTEKVWQPLVL